MKRSLATTELQPGPSKRVATGTNELWETYFTRKTHQNVEEGDVLYHRARAYMQDFYYENLAASLEVKKSVYVPIGNEKGLFAKRPFLAFDETSFDPYTMLLGEYIGLIYEGNKQPALSTTYLFDVFHSGELLFSIDANPDLVSYPRILYEAAVPGVSKGALKTMIEHSLMSFPNAVRKKTEDAYNAEFFKFEGSDRIFLRPVRDIREGEEIVTHYGPNNSQFLREVSSVAPPFSIDSAVVSNKKDWAPGLDNRSWRAYLAGHRLYHRVPEMNPEPEPALRRDAFQFFHGDERRHQVQALLPLPPHTILFEYTGKLVEVTKRKATTYFDADEYMGVWDGPSKRRILYAIKEDVNVSRDAFYAQSAATRDTANAIVVQFKTSGRVFVVSLRSIKRREDILLYRSRTKFTTRDGQRTIVLHAPTLVLEDERSFWKTPAFQRYVSKAIRQSIHEDALSSYERRLMELPSYKRFNLYPRIGSVYDTWRSLCDQQDDTVYQEGFPYRYDKLGPSRYFMVGECTGQPVKIRANLQNLIGVYSPDASTVVFAIDITQTEEIKMMDAVQFTTDVQKANAVLVQILESGRVFVCSTSTKRPVVFVKMAPVSPTQTVQIHVPNILISETDDVAKCLAKYVLAGFTEKRTRIPNSRISL